MDLLIPVAAVVWCSVAGLISRRQDGVTRVVWVVIALAPLAVLFWASAVGHLSQRAFTVALATIALLAIIGAWLPLGRRSRPGQPGQREL